MSRFYIPASVALTERRPRILKHGDTFGVFDHYGDILAAAGTSDGLYHRDTRQMSGLQLLINGHRPLLLSSTVQDNNTLLLVDLTNPDFLAEGEPVLRRDSIHLSRAKFIWNAVCYERLAIRNFADRRITLKVSFVFEADFLDLFEVRGHKRTRRGQTAVEAKTDHVVFRYCGLDQQTRLTTLRLSPRPQQLGQSEAAFELSLAPQGRTTLFTSTDCASTSRRSTCERSFFGSLRGARRDLRASTAQAASVVTSNEIFNETLCRSMADLYMLITNTAHGPYPYAGIPWFSTAFGRDGIITAIQMLWVDPGIARGVLYFLAATQAQESNPEADAEPGKILHETRNGEMARLGEVPFRMYYGSVDATPLFVVLAGLYLERTGDIETISDLWPSIEAALSWIDTHGDLDGDGFVEYQSQASGGLSNQGWKDSHDSIFHADGRLAQGAIALAEVQGYVYMAKRQASAMARALSRSALSATLAHQATALRDRFDAKYWCDDISTYALALDGDKKPCRVRSSNAGQTLFTGIANQDRARQLAATMFSRDFFSGWGIRTIASSEALYNPMSYHNGSVWPHDNALIALGLARYGFQAQVGTLFGALFDASASMDLRRLPELFCGFRRQPGKGPTFYPVACSPQAWASATPFALLQAVLGMRIDHSQQKIVFKHPRLPDFLDEVLLRTIRVGASELDISIRRRDHDVAVSVVRKTGGAGVIVII